MFSGVIDNGSDLKIGEPSSNSNRVCYIYLGENIARISTNPKLLPIYGLLIKTCITNTVLTQKMALNNRKGW